MKDLFRKIAGRISIMAGSPPVFLLAITIIVVWALTGPIFDYSNTWQLIINTGTTIVTFLMVFLIQNTQNRDSKAQQLKLDELIRATRARDAFVELESLSEEELAELDREFHHIHEGQAGSAVMKKLHKTIQLEHELRKHGFVSMDTLNDLFRKKK